LVVALPVVRWFMIVPLNPRWINFSAVTTSLGQLAGIIGLTLFAINLLFSARAKIWDDFFYGLNNLYVWHARIGALAFSLLLFHPLLLVVKYVSVSLMSAVGFFLPSQGWPTFLGVIALSGMIIVLSITFYVFWKYQNWKLSHKFMVAVFVFAWLHAALIPSDISRDMFLRYYLLGLGLGGFLAGAYQALLSRIWNRHYIYDLAGLRRLNEQTIELELAPRKRRLVFSPGQFIFIRFFGNDIRSESHPFSLTSNPGEKNLSLAVKSLGDFTSELQKIKPGMAVSIEGPYGKFSHLNIRNNKQVWVAGGVGITPFLSMARSLVGTEYEIDLYYCVNEPAEAILMEELKAVSASQNNFRLIPWYSKTQGRITGQKISEMSGGLGDKDIFLCGPPAFMSSLQRQCLMLKIPGKNIHFENFAL